MADNVQNKIDRLKARSAQCGRDLDARRRENDLCIREDQHQQRFVQLLKGIWSQLVDLDPARAWLYRQKLERAEDFILSERPYHKLVA